MTAGECAESTPNPMAGLTAGRIMHYVLTEDDARDIERRRNDYGANVNMDAWPGGAQAHVGNPVSAGEHVPMVVVRVWPNEFGDEPGVNGQVFLDGNDSLWVMSRRVDNDGKRPGTVHWIEKA